MKKESLHFVLEKKSLFAIFFLAAALALMGFFLFQKADKSVIPPFFDALSYVMKAKNFWDAVSSAQPFNPFNLAPYFRPPGTILLTYPFGFSPTPNGFFFRSIFIPITLFSFTLFFSATPFARKASDYRLVISMCLFFSTLPLFFHFEPNPERLYSPTFWGMVDNFFAAWAAFSVMLLIRGATSGSYYTTLGGAAAGAFCLAIKPAGGFIMVAVFFVWLIFLLWGYGFSLKNIVKDKTRLQYVAICIGGFSFFYLSLLAISLLSSYLSINNFKFGHAAIATIKRESSTNNLARYLIMQIRSSLGLQFLVIFLTAVPLSYYQSFKSFKSDKKRLAAEITSAVFILIFGIWFWIIYTSLFQERFFFPFLLITVVIIFPRLFLSISQLDNRISGGISFIFCAWFLFMTWLIAMPNPPVALQKQLGVNLTSGSMSREVKQAKSLVKKARSIGKDLLVYSVGVDCKHGVFAGEGLYQKIILPGWASFYTVYSMDYVRETTIRFHEMAQTDYILFKPVTDDKEKKNILDSPGSLNLDFEKAIVRVYLTDAGKDSGLETVSRVNMQLSRITDKNAFITYMERLLPRYHFRRVFRQANPSRWHNEVDDIPAGPGRSEPAYFNVNFGNAFLLLRASVDRTGDEIICEFVWESLLDQRLENMVLVHIIDEKGDILETADYPQDTKKTFVRKGIIWKDTLRIKVESAGKIAIGVGVYFPPDKFFLTSHDRSDLNGRRLIINSDY